MKELPNYYSVIPSIVRYDGDLKPNEKLLYGEISSLTNKEGICYASNSYFAKLYQVNKKTISRWIAHLESKNYISTDICYKKDSKEVEKRAIKINGIPINEKIDTYLPNDTTPGDKKAEDNNTSINNKKKIYKRKVFKPPTLEEVKAYCQERKNEVDPQKFFDYYEASSWYDQNGKSVKNWKQKVITWEGNRASPQRKKTPDWLDKDIKAEELSEDEKAEMLNLMKEFR